MATSEQLRVEELHREIVEAQRLLHASLQAALQEHASRQNTALLRLGLQLPPVGAGAKRLGTPQDENGEGHIIFDADCPVPLPAGPRTSPQRAQDATAPTRPGDLYLKEASSNPATPQGPGQDPSMLIDDSNASKSPSGHRSRRSSQHNSQLNRAGSKKMAQQLIKLEHGSRWRQLLFANSYFNRAATCWTELKEPPRTGLIARLVSGQMFESLVVCVIFLNCVHTVSNTNKEVQAAASGTLKKVGNSNLIELLFLIFYTAEMIFKVLVHRQYYFCNDEMNWNLFDFSLVMLGLVDQVIQMTMKGSGTVKIVFMRVLRILRLARILRGLKAMRFFSELRLMLTCLLGSVASLFWSMVMLTFIFYIFALFFVQGVSQHFEEEAALMTDDDIRRMMDYYGSVQRTMLTLYMASTGGMDWEFFWILIEPARNKVLMLFFISFIQIALLNILTGIFVENAMKSAQPDLEALALEHREKEVEDITVLRQICKDMGLDEGRGPSSEGKSLSRQDFCDALDIHKFRDCMECLGLHHNDSDTLYEAILHAACPEEDLKTYNMTVEDFVHGCIRLQGQASKMDMVTMKSTMMRLHSWQSSLDYQQRECLQLLEQRRTGKGQQVGDEGPMPLDEFENDARSRRWCTS